MKRKIIIGVFVFLFVTAIGIGLTNIEKNKLGNINQETNKISGIVLEKSNEKIAIQDNKNIIYTFSLNATNFEVGDNVIIEYTGLMDNNNCMECEVISYTSLDTSTDSNGIPVNWLDNGIFSSYYNLAYNKLKTMTLEEKIGQIFLVRYPDTNQTAVIDKYKVAGFVFYEKDFKDKTKNEVINMIKNLQDASNIPLLTAVDEEGGRVIRISSNANLVSEPFKSPSQLYQEGGLELIKEDTINKSKILNELGINLNLAPVVDVSENPIDYMYDRTIQQNTEIT